MAYTTNQAIAALNDYLGIEESQKEYIDDTKERGFVLTLDSGEKVVIFVYPLVHKQDNTKNYFDTRDSGAYERGVTWNYSISHKLKYFCLGVNDSVDKYTGYIFSLECCEQIIEKISGTANGVRNGPGNQIIIPNDYIPQKPFERISNKLGIFIACINRSKIIDYLSTYDNRPYMLNADVVDLNQLQNDPVNPASDENEYRIAADHLHQYVIENGFEIPQVRSTVETLCDTFQQKFAPAILMDIPDDKLLQAMFYTTEQTNDSLCYWLEFNTESRQYCGSIAGGSSFKFGLFQKKEDRTWITGSPNKPQELSENEALTVGKEIRQVLVDGCAAIESQSLVSLSDYEELNDKLHIAMGEKYWNLAWIHKYFCMMYPNKFSGFHSSEWQRHVLYALQIRPSEKYYARSGQIAMVSQYADWIYAELFSVFYDQFGDIKRFLRLGTSDDDGKYADEWRQRNIVAIGWKELGCLDDYVIANEINRKAVAEKMEQLYYPSDARVASRKAGEVSAFYRTNANSIFVAVDGYSLLGLVDNIGSYFYTQDSSMAHRKPGTWHQCFNDGEQLPNKNAGYLTSCYELSAENDIENMMFLYRKYYYEMSNSEIKEDDVMETIEYKPLVFKTKVDIGKDRNRIVFGAPGTGKSFRLKHDCEQHIEAADGVYERVTFHPDYTYSQFVGAYKPVSDGTAIRYEFVPGPFMRVYIEALESGRTENPKPHLLLIEEINRAKVAAVFGDVFQLLDRDDDGVSEYAIQASEDISKYLASKLGGKATDYKLIRIPNNMYIWATMNSADQGVFPMDTAFKRRWSFEYLGINENESKVRGSVVLGTETNQKVEWNVLRKAINEKLAKEYKVNEDKLMGPFFLSKKVLRTISDSDDTIADAAQFIETFKSKVIMYLYEDAAKQHKHKLFSGCEDTSKYSAICESFEKYGMQIFSKDFEEAYYNPQKG